MATINFSTNIRLGLWLDDLKLGIKEGLKTVAPLQPEVIGIDAFSAELSPRALSQSGRRDLANMVRMKGMTLSSLRADLGGRRLADPQTLDVNLSRIRDALEMSAHVGAKALVVPAGYIPPDEKGNATVRAALTEAARTLAGFVSNVGVRVCWVGGNEAPEVLADFLKQADPSGLLDVEFNPGGLVMRGLDPLSGLNPIASRVYRVRAVDHYQGGAEAPFGKGDVQWGAVIVGISSLNRNTPIDFLAGTSLEGDRVQMLAQAYRRLQELRKNPMG
jgi:sugar phosphate isomerase/epimerase